MSLRATARIHPETGQPWHTDARTAAAASVPSVQPSVPSPPEPSNLQKRPDEWSQRVNRTRDDEQDRVHAVNARSGNDTVTGESSAGVLIDEGGGGVRSADDKSGLFGGDDGVDEGVHD
ncbi:hypothetical protein GGX14DRAFT_579053 [Mycena pura]|uniref:Uncharacterized protein n=1 Tax=Mycena pura TaxID=153505 RepID=A0AAD6Y4M3_9AGAR|nr:hypothetical protein GGX14DRAFT_579053 [Mycena pura]